MKYTILLLALIGVAIALPQTQSKKSNFRRIYVQPSSHRQGSIMPRIIGGQEVIPHSIPYQLFITVNGTEDGEKVQWLCGATLISRKFILTAGHCGYQATGAEVLLGAHNITDNNEKTQVKINTKNIIVHEDFDMDNILNDISVMELETPVDLNDNIQVVTLPSRADANKTYEDVTAKVSGWGLTDGFGDSVSPVLMYVENDILSNQECKQTFNILQPYEICLNGEDGRSSCNGDSGGPLTTNTTTGRVQIGIVSYGVVFCLEDYPSAFTRTGSFLDWIQKNTDVVIN